FQRLYGTRPFRIDGHHHLHLCPNVAWTGLLPAGTVVRRNFSFPKGEKSVVNRWYRGVTDRLLARRHILTDYFCSLAPLQPEARSQHIFSLANSYTVEVGTHPAHLEELTFLISDEMASMMGSATLALPHPLQSGAGVIQVR